MLERHVQPWALYFMQTLTNEELATASVMHQLGRPDLAPNYDPTDGRMVVALIGGCPFVEGHANDDRGDAAELPSYILDFFGGELDEFGTLRLPEKYVQFADLKLLPNVEWRFCELDHPVTWGVFYFELPDGVAPTAKGAVEPLDDVEEGICDF